MAIHLNARPQQWKAESLFKGFAELWKDARNTRMASAEGQYVAYWKKTNKTMRNIAKLLGTSTVNDFEAPFRSTFNWDALKWGEFRSSAVTIYTTLIPAALAEVALHRAKLMDTDIDTNGDVTYSNPLSQAEKDAINATLQAIENQYDLATG